MDSIPRVGGLESPPVRSRLQRCRVLLAALPVLAAAACGGSGPAGNGSSTEADIAAAESTTVPGESPTVAFVATTGGGAATPDPSVPITDAMRRLLLEAGDLPGSWTAEAVKLDSLQAFVAFSVLGFRDHPECQEVIEARTAHVRDAERAVFVSGPLTPKGTNEAAAIRNTVEIHSTGDAATGEVEFLRGILPTEAFRACVSAEESAAAGATIAGRKVRTTEASVSLPAPNGGVAVAILIEHSGGGAATTFGRLEFYAWQRGKYLAFVSILTRTGQAAPATVRAAVETLDRHVQAARD